MAANEKIKCVHLTMAKSLKLHSQKGEQEVILLANWLESAQQAIGQLILFTYLPEKFFTWIIITQHWTTWWHNNYCYVITDHTNLFNYVSLWVTIAGFW